MEKMERKIAPALIAAFATIFFVILILSYTDYGILLSPPSAVGLRKSPVIECDFVSQCSDGLDNDNDGLCDFSGCFSEGRQLERDRGCSFQNDNNELNGLPGDYMACKTQCSDGLDNDGEGKIDWPDDPKCSSERDNSELG